MNLVTKEKYHSMVLGLFPSVWQDRRKPSIRFSRFNYPLFIFGLLLKIRLTPDLKSG